MSNIFLENFNNLQKIKEKKSTWNSIEQLSIELSINNRGLIRYKKELLDMGFVFLSLTKPFVEKYNKELDQLLKDERIEWETFKDLVEAISNEDYKKYRHDKKKVEKLGFKFTGILNAVDSNIDKLNHMIQNNKTEFESVSALMKYIGTDIPMHKHQKQLKEMGFTFLRGNPRSFFIKNSEALSELIKKKENRTTINELAKKLSVSRNTIVRNESKLKELGFSFTADKEKKVLDPSNPKNFLVINSDTLNQLSKNNEIFTTLELANKLNVSEQIVYNNRKKLQKMGILYPYNKYVFSHIDNLKNYINKGKNKREHIREFAFEHNLEYKQLIKGKETLEKIGFDLDIKEEIFRERDKEEKLFQYLNEGKTKWPTYKALMEDLGFERIRQRKKQDIINLGFEFDSNIQIIDKHKEKLQELLNEGKNKWKSISHLLVEIGAQNSTHLLKKRDELIEMGFEFITTKNKFENMIDKVLELKKEGIASFETIKELSEKIGYETQYLNLHIDDIEEQGVYIENISYDNINFIETINKIDQKGILISSPSSFKTIAKHFFCRTISTSERKLEAILRARNLFVELNNKEIELIIKNAIQTLLSNDIDGFSLRELSYQVLLDGYCIDDSELEFFCNKYDEELLEAESIFHKIRLANRMDIDKFILVEFTNKLPIINNIETPTLIVDEKEKDNLYKLWQSFILYALTELNTISIFKYKDLQINNKIDDIYTVINRYPAIKEREVFFLSDDYKEAFSTLSWGGILALYLHTSEGIKSGTTFSQLQTIIAAFLMWNVSKKRCLLSPTFLKFKGIVSMLNAAEIILKKHKLLILHNYFIDNSQKLGITSNSLKKLTGKYVHLNTFSSASSLLFNFDPLKITSKDFNAYSKSTLGLNKSGSVLNETYMETILKLSGNKIIKPPKEKFDAKKEFNKLLYEAGASTETLSVYEDFISQMRSIIIFRFEKDHISQHTIIGSIGDFILLIQFLDSFKKRLSADELMKKLDNIYGDKDESSMINWIKTKVAYSRYISATSTYYMLFENLPKNSEYYKIYERKWVLKKEKIDSPMSIIRDGLEPAVYEALQYTAYHNPASTPEYPTRTVTPSGELLDMSWWKHKDSNPVIAVCTWLITKLPRRGKHIRNLDVRKFLQHKQSNGEFFSMHINTDKNQKKSANNKHILARYVRMIFNDEELKLLENYVQYVKNAFSDYGLVPYENQTKNYSTIQPLFPNLDKQAVIGAHTITGHYNKTLVKTEFELKRRSEKGELNKYYEDYNRERRIEGLLNTDFCYSRFKQNKAGDILDKPKTEKEFLNSKITIAQWNSHFKTDGGIHNLRGAGASYLMTVKSLHVSQAIILTGHTSVITLLDIYFKGNDNIVTEKISAVTGEYLDINKPVSETKKIIEKKLVPIAKSLEPEKLEKALKESNFMSLERTILSREHEDIYGSLTESRKRYPDDIIDDGLKIASKFHPDTYEVFHHGICTINRRCPAESNQECCFCPHLLFNIMHLEGIRYKLQKATHELALNQNKMKDPKERRNADNLTLYSQEKSRKIAEVIAWNEMLTMVLEQIDSFHSNDNENSSSHTLSCIEKESDKILGARIIDSDMMSLETLELARKININDNYRETHEYKVFSQALLSAVRRKDNDFINKLEEGGIDYIMNNYGSKSFEEKITYHKKIMSADVSTDALKNNRAKIDKGFSNSDDIIDIELLSN